MGHTQQEKESRKSPRLPNKVDDATIAKIKKLWTEQSVDPVLIAERFGISKTTVRDILGLNKTRKRKQ